ncbi:MAG: Asp-tRNA(Asn)/Glu-tRNA(Gln) amidotransferase subunit GatC [Planctomycetes bacterium]|nr:Asp-tRNA(Asn)/Glu-tRNA(Gln) amidotransferase subunit GatC [Planctomycetota bacterium]
MHLTSEHVRKVAALARLRVSDAEVESLLGDLTSILEYVDVLNEVDTTGVQPMVHAVELHDVMRDDMIVASLPRADALKNAPRTDGTYFLVPTIIDEG